MLAHRSHIFALRQVYCKHIGTLQQANATCFRQHNASSGLPLPVSTATADTSNSTLVRTSHPSIMWAVSRHLLAAINTSGRALPARREYHGSNLCAADVGCPEYRGPSISIVVREDVASSLRRPVAGARRIVRPKKGPPLYLGPVAGLPPEGERRPLKLVGTSSKPRTEWTRCASLMLKCCLVHPQVVGCSFVGFMCSSEWTRWISL